MRRRVEELAALQETVLDITGRHDLPELLNSIVERASRLLARPAEECTSAIPRSKKYVVWLVTILVRMLWGR